jgi:hypothetical protein
MESDRESLSAAHPWIAGPDPAELRDAWRRRSLASGWLAAEDWDSDAVRAVVAAACGTGTLSLACDRLGRSRATAGIGIAETIDDLAALFGVLDDSAARVGPAHSGLAERGPAHGGPAESGPAERGPAESGPAHSGPAEGGPTGGGLPLPLVCSIAAGWAEEGLAQLSGGGCEDPLSGLATVPYLRTRLAELYREATQGGTNPADTHRLLVVSLPSRPDPWRRMALAIVVGHDLRTAFPGGETLSLARRNGITGTGLAIALVRVRADLPMRYARLRRTIRGSLDAQIRMTRLPSLLPEALRLVDELGP